MSTAAFAARLTALAALALATTTAQAAIFLTENMAATLDGTTTFGGVALGSPTAFSFEAVFAADPLFNEAADAPGIGIYPIISLSVTIAGQGTYAATLDTPLFTLLLDPANSLYPVPFAGLFGSDNGGFYSAFLSTTPVLDAHAPSPVVYGSYLATLYGDPLTIGLNGVTGGLVISGGLANVSASLTVPEPATYALVSGLTLVAFVGWRQRSR